jgi:hypothetical protein
LKKDKVILLLILIISGIIVIIRHTHCLPMLDYQYNLESAYRMFTGDIPHKDYLQVYPMGNYFVIALLMKIFGLTNTINLIYSVLVQILTIFITFKILSLISKETSLSLFLLLPLLFTGQAFYPFPSYNTNVSLFVLIAFYFLIKTYKRKFDFKYLIPLGFVICLPILFKHNIGIIFFVVTFSILFLLKFNTESNLNTKKFFIIISGSLIFFVLIFIYLSVNKIIPQTYYDLFVFPNQQRAVYKSILRVFLGMFDFQYILFYLSFLIPLFLIKKIDKEKLIKVNNYLFLPVIFSFIIIPIILFVAIPHFPKTSGDYFFNNWNTGVVFYYYFGFGLMLILFSLFYFIKEILEYRKRKINFINYLPFILIAVLFSSFLATGVGGQLNIYPIIILLIPLLICKFPFDNKYNLVKNIKFISILLAMIFLIYINFFSYAPTEFKNVTFSSIVEFRGLSSKDEYIQRMERLVSFVNNNIPENERLAIIPGETPIYYAAHRKSYVPWIHLDWNVYYSDISKIYYEIMNNDIKWIILENNSRGGETYIQKEEFTKLKDMIYNEYFKINEFDSFEILVRK